jgi:hypothetical protein
MTDEEARQQVERTDAFIAAFRELIASTVVDPASPCEVSCRRGLDRIAATVDAVDYVTFCNLANALARSFAIFLSSCSRRIGVIRPVPWHSSQSRSRPGRRPGTRPRPS